MLGAVPLLPQHVFNAWCSVKQRDNFNFTFTTMERLSERKCLGQLKSQKGSETKITILQQNK
jgi:hypothetical protein